MFNWFIRGDRTKELIHHSSEAMLALVRRVRNLPVNTDEANSPTDT